MVGIAVRLAEVEAVPCRELADEMRLLLGGDVLANQSPGIYSLRALELGGDDVVDGKVIAEEPDERDDRA